MSDSNHVVFRGIELVLVHDHKFDAQAAGLCAGCFNRPKRTYSCSDIIKETGHDCSEESFRFMLPVEAVVMRLNK